MKYVFIVNPVSGRGKSKEIVKGIKRVCQEDNIDYIIHYTSKNKGDLISSASLIASEYKKEKNVIFSVGGDGTLNEVLNGLVGSENMLGIIPVGSGNDFYKIIKKMKDEYPLVDIGRVKCSKRKFYFLNVASVGIDAEVGGNAELMKKKWYIPNKYIYQASIIHTFLKFKPIKLKVKMNNEKMTGKFTLVTVCNGEYYGSKYHIAPEAKYNDGLFDIYYAEEIKKSSIPGLIKKLENGKHEESVKVHRKISQKIEISEVNGQEIPFGFDGEIIYDNSFKIDILKNKITIYNDKKLINRIMGVNNE